MSMEKVKSASACVSAALMLFFPLLYMQHILIIFAEQFITLVRFITTMDKKLYLICIRRVLITDPFNKVSAQDQYTSSTLD